MNNNNQSLLEFTLRCQNKWIQAKQREKEKTKKNTIKKNIHAFQQMHRVTTVLQMNVTSIAGVKASIYQNIESKYLKCFKVKQPVNLSFELC